MPATQDGGARCLFTVYHGHQAQTASTAAVHENPDPRPPTHNNWSSNRLLLGEERDGEEVGSHSAYLPPLIPDDVRRGGPRHASLLRDDSLRRHHLSSAGSTDPGDQRSAPGRRPRCLAPAGGQGARSVPRAAAVGQSTVDRLTRPAVRRTPPAPSRQPSRLPERPTRTAWPAPSWQARCGCST
ncbi:hypothetical protein BD413DRAFT_538825 [Trametes elegans]|nr:hypothetical protein BD413DRAFT_538825 [Trametes elegans]